MVNLSKTFVVLPRVAQVPSCGAHAIGHCHACHKKGRAQTYFCRKVAKQSGLYHWHGTLRSQ